MAEVPEEFKNLYQRIHAVCTKTGLVTKRGKNEALRYSYATEADVIEEIREPLLEERLLILPSVNAFAVDQHGNAAVTLVNRVMNIDNPNEYWDFEMVGSGNDMTKNGPRDKALMKATTAASKYTLLKLFMLATGDDPEESRAEEFDTDELLSGAKVQQSRQPQRTTRSQVQPQTGAIAGSVGVISSVPDNVPALPPQTPEEIQVAQLIRPAEAQQLTNAVTDIMTPAPPPDDPQTRWAVDMRRKAEDSRSSDEVMEIWNSERQNLWSLKTANEMLHRDLHAFFRTRKETLKEQGQ